MCCVGLCRAELSCVVLYCIALYAMLVSMRASECLSAMFAGLLWSRLVCCSISLSCSLARSLARPLSLALSPSLPPRVGLFMSCAAGTQLMHDAICGNLRYRVDPSHCCEGEGRKIFVISFWHRFLCKAGNGMQPLSELSGQRNC